MYALIVVVIYKLVRCVDIEKLQKMEKEFDKFPKVKLERLNINRSHIKNIIMHKIHILKSKYQYHNLMEKLTTHAKFVAPSHDLNILVDFLRDNVNNVTALEKMQKYIKDLNSYDFEKKFLSNTVIAKDDIKQVLNSIINNKNNDKSEKIMKKLKVLIYVHNDDNIMPLRQLYNDIKNREIRLKDLSSKLRELSDMSQSKFEEKYTDAINFSQNSIVRAIQYKINKIKRLRSLSSR
jgi:hypothetical protein